MSDSNKSVCVIGLGYIGLPTASMFATNGYFVHGVDVNPAVVKTLSEGNIHIEEPGLSTVVKAAISSKNLRVDTKPAPADVFIITVPTPYKKNEKKEIAADMSYVESAMNSILPFLKKGNLVILESTSPPLTIRDLIVPMIEKENFKVGDDIGVAYCPERVIPGRALIELVGNDRVVGAINQVWGEKTKQLYRSFVSGEIFVTDPTVAEMVKILENTYRDVNIALANEVALLCEKLGISVWEVLKITNRHPRVNVHRPGPGVGGHCISVDPWFLVEKFHTETDIIPLARRINDRMPNHVFKTIKNIVGAKTKGKVAILGLAYKGNVDDMRESPAIKVLDLIKTGLPGFDIGIYDPHIDTKDFPRQSLESVFQGADLAVVLTPHDDYKLLDPEAIGNLMNTRVVYDTHNLLKSEKWVPAGFEFYTLGTGDIAQKDSVPAQK